SRSGGGDTGGAPQLRGPVRVICDRLGWLGLARLLHCSGPPSCSSQSISSPRFSMPKSIRRVVTGHNTAGRSVLIMDGAAPHAYQRSPGSAVVTELWETRASPADNRGSAEVTDHPF